ncbi:MAG: hypothetical protein PHY71_02185 [Bacteroidaceae bacterium]|nr:hypothetical protein [Bacteroidaceae bacterium]
MSILKTLQAFLAKYDGLEILTDFPGKEAGYALSPSGNSMTKEDILGNKIYINNYVFYVKECAVDEVDRADTQDFLESFGMWLDEQSYPELPGNFSVVKMTTSNCFLLDIADDGLGLYQVQIQLTIKKEVN